MFGTSGIRGPVGTEITATLASDAGRALASDGYDRVVVARDARESGQMLENALVAGLQECGATAVRLGVQSTPALARAVGWLDADAGVGVTASHNPETDNGLKFWLPSGIAFGPEERDALADRMESGEYDRAAWDGLGDDRRRDLGDRHRAALRERLAGTDGLDGLSVVVDVGNGTGRVTADVLADVGSAVTTLHGQTDGRFPGRESEPTAETCRALRDHVAATDADLGVAHDGDADRTMAVTETGSFVAGDQLLALFGREVAGEGDAVAAPLNTSLAVDDALATVGAEVVRTKVGDVYVADACRDDRVVFGGEPSGAWIWPGQTMCPDGPLAACTLAGMVAAGDTLSALLAGVDTYPIERRSVETTAKSAVVETVADRVRERYDDVQELDGVRVETDDGWFLVRASGTQPLVRITVEGRSRAQTEALSATATELVDEALADVTA
ncbi:phosphoglucosamine mutase [Salinirubrum litoreum]|uniref:Phosphoglucosamine mutase n=1 Tax=Salinirubrum litoreum TaxID=1126234 RepID=A0ABD5RCB9_9EURY|nr:phosphoglucosamine mutase [Salinirubrum litoreum]